MDSSQQMSSGDQESDQHDTQYQSHHQHDMSSGSFATPLRPIPSSHAEAHAALAAVAAAASAGSIQMTPDHGQPSTSYDESGLGPTPSPFGTHLGRNKACQSCRARKLKCDGQKPVCSQCAKAWSIKFRLAQNKSKNKKKGGDNEDESNKPLHHIPPCVYLSITQRQSTGKRNSRLSTPSAANTTMDDTESPLPAGKKRKRTDDDNDQVARLQQEIDRLKRQLSHVTGIQAQASGSGSASAHHPSKDELAIAHMLATGMPSGEDHGEDSSGQPFPGGIATAPPPLRQEFNQSGQSNGMRGVLDPALDPAFFAPSQVSESSYPQAYAPNARMSLQDQVSAQRSNYARQAKVTDQNQDYTSPLLELMVTSWPADFPPPTTVTLLVTTYLESCQLQALFVNPPVFMERLSLGPQHPLFPDRGLLHGMFAHAYPRLKGVDNLPGSFLGPSISTASGSSPADRRASLASAAAFHAERAKNLYQKAASHGNFLDATRTLCLLTSYNYINDRSFDAWATSGGVCSLAKAMEINRLAPIRTLAMSEEERKASKAHRPKAAIFRATIRKSSGNVIEHEERLRLFWSCYYSDRAACASTLWAQNIDDLDIKTELPSAFQDFLERSPSLAYRERQTLASPDLFTAKHYDQALLHIKAVILHSKCIGFMSRQKNDATIEDILTPHFHQLDNLISSFVQSFPVNWRDIRMYDPMLMPMNASEPDYLYDGVNHRPKKQLNLMTIQLVMAHVLSFGASIALHEPIASHVPDSGIKSALAADAIVNLIKIFVAARVDIGQLGSIITQMIVFAGRCHARQYKQVRMQAAKAYVEIKKFQNPSFNFDAGKNGVAPHAILPAEEGARRSLEEEMENEMDLDPSLQARVDPDGSLASLRDDLELIFWTLVKYGESFPIGVGQARIVAQLLGKDFSPQMEARGLFYRGGSSYTGGTSDSGSVSDSGGTPNRQASYMR